MFRSPEERLSCLLMGPKADSSFNVAHLVKGMEIMSLPSQVQGATEEEKQYQIQVVEALQERNAEKAAALIKDLQDRCVNNQNSFEALMEVCKYASLGQITSSLFKVGGQYRRNM